MFRTFLNFYHYLLRFLNFNAVLCNTPSALPPLIAKLIWTRQTCCWYHVTNAKKLKIKNAEKEVQRSSAMLYSWGAGPDCFSSVSNAALRNSSEYQMGENKSKIYESNILTWRRHAQILKPDFVKYFQLVIKLHFVLFWIINKHLTRRNKKCGFNCFKCSIFGTSSSKHIRNQFQWSFFFTIFILLINTSRKLW